MAPYSNKHLNQFKIEFIPEINFNGLLFYFFTEIINTKMLVLGTWYRIPKNNSRYQMIIQYNIKKLN
jgi:hypothetical protein